MAFYFLAYGRLEERLKLAYKKNQWLQLPGNSFTGSIGTCTFLEAWTLDQQALANISIVYLPSASAGDYQAISFEFYFESGGIPGYASNPSVTWGEALSVDKTTGAISIGGTASGKTYTFGSYFRVDAERIVGSWSKWYLDYDVSPTVENAVGTGSTSLSMSKPGSSGVPGKNTHGGLRRMQSYISFAV